MITERLRLRRWQAEDCAAFAAMNADENVCAFLPSPLTEGESNAAAQRIQTHFDMHGFGLWVVELQKDNTFIGYTGLANVPFHAHFTPAVEIGWRLAHAHWGKGYATEAAMAAIGYGFNTLRLNEIVSFTVPENLRSRRVMEKLGMAHDEKEDFDHPLLPKTHRLNRHVLYRARNSL